MKPIIYSLIVLCALATACKKTSKPHISRFIVAGNASASDKHTPYTPAYYIEPIYDSFAGQYVYRGAGSLMLDISSASGNDVEVTSISHNEVAPFGSFYNGALGGNVNPTLGTYVTSINPSITFADQIFHQGDTIDRTANWISFPPQMNLYLLTSYKPPFNNQPEVINNNWTGTNNYLGICTINGTDTLYGFIGIQVEQYDSIMVREYAMNK